MSSTASKPRTPRPPKVKPAPSENGKAVKKGATPPASKALPDEKPVKFTSDARKLCEQIKGVIVDLKLAEGWTEDRTSRALVRSSTLIVEKEMAEQLSVSGFECVGKYDEMEPAVRKFCQTIADNADRIVVIAPTPDEQHLCVYMASSARAQNGSKRGPAAPKPPREPFYKAEDDKHKIVIHAKYYRDLGGPVPRVEMWECQPDGAWIPGADDNGVDNRVIAIGGFPLRADVFATKPKRIKVTIELVD